MRKCTSNKKDGSENWFHQFDPMFGNVFFGFSTGFDYCAEHEMGIKKLQQAAGIIRLKDLKPIRKKWYSIKRTELQLGLDRTTIKNKNLILQGIAEMEDGSEYYLLGYNTNGNIPLKFTDDFEAYWDEKSFLIASKDKEKMTSLAFAAYNENLAFTTSENVLEDHAGLRLVIKSNTPIPIIDQCRKDDERRYELMLKHRESEIERILRNSGCEYFACSPYWKDYDKKEIHWWVNPKDQKNINHGYFNYNDLLAWTRGEGPLIKTEKEKKEESNTEFKY